MVELNHQLYSVVMTGAVLPVFAVQWDMSAWIGENILVFKELAEKYTFSVFL
ncbi:hypothetical protein [Chryseobacterium sp. KBW03]|uniref:hypothetical protein n=1 Tax=Chryseobacterium sp. KBW03 TaxID=2153362 RepID=UPI001625B0B5|nr:hypothetical protein [Chryseobacterium sp. KBW03]